MIADDAEGVEPPKKKRKKDKKKAATAEEEYHATDADGLGSLDEYHTGQDEGNAEEYYTGQDQGNAEEYYTGQDEGNAEEYHMELEQDEHDYTKYEEVEDYASYDQEQVEEDVFKQPLSPASPKKKKKKKKAAEPDLISGDIPSDSQSESQPERESGKKRRKPGITDVLVDSSVPLYQQDLTEDVKQQINQYKHRAGLDDHISRAVRKQVDTMKNAEEQVVYKLPDDFIKKQKSKKFTPSTEVLQRKKPF
jgi:hypothetical protein